MPIAAFKIKEWDSYLTLLSVLMIPATKSDTALMYKDDAVRNALPLLNDEMFLGAFTTENRAPAKHELDVREIYDGVDNTMQVSDAYTREHLAQEIISQHPELADSVASILPWQSSPNLKACLLRDVRNFFYAKNQASFLKSLKNLMRHYPDSFKGFEPLSFLEHHIISQWILTIPPQMMSFAANNFLPLASANLWDTTVWQEALKQNLDKLDDSTRLNLVDLYLLQGHLESAKGILQNMEGDSKQLREAWIAFLENDNERSIRLYQDVLDRMRAQPKQQTAYFRSIGGVFFILALMKGGEDFAKKAGEYAVDAAGTPFLGSAYKCLALQQKQIVIQEEVPASTPLSKYFSFFCDLANETLSASNVLSIVDDYRFRLENYPWLWRQICEAVDLFHGREGAGEAIIPYCFNFRQPWQRVIDKLNDVLRKPREVDEARLVWVCNFDEKDLECPVRIRPVEQHITKGKRWNKGRQFPLAKYIELKTMPAFLTNQDKVICNILATEFNERFSPEVKDAQGNFRMVQAVHALSNHPNLFWENQDMTPFSCKTVVPTMAIRESGDNLEFAIYPQYNGNVFNFIPRRDEQGDLILYEFSELHKDIIREIGSTFSAPKSIASQAALIIRPLAEAFQVLSYASLGFLDTCPQKTDVTPHLKLVPGDNSMTVEVLMQPFSSSGEFFHPASGPMEMLTMEMNMLERYVRDFKEEEEQANIVVMLCEVLNDENRTGNWSWQLGDLETCCKFTLALQNISKQIQVHWPDNHKLRISRRVTLKDMSVKCLSTNDWFSIEGSIKVDDGLLVSLKEILLAAKKQHGNFIRLDDGQIIALADSFRKRLDDFAAVAYEVEGDDDTALRFNNYALPFMENLLKESMSANEAAKLSERADAIRAAMALSPAVPDKLKATLRQYQIEGYTWLSRLDAWHAGACLADDMGLGKTIQTISFILSKADEGPVLIVAPTSVCANWMQEIKKFAPSLKPVIFGGLKRLRLLQDLGPRKVLISSYGLLQSEAEEFDKVQWRVAILDEAQAIKNHNTKRSRAAVKLNATFRVVTTGTPMENNLNELWSIFNFINPGLLGTHETFQDDFAVPIEKGRDEETLKRLTAIVSTFILRRRKSQVLKELPPKTEIQLHVDMSDEEWAFYKALRLQLLEDIQGTPADNGTEQMRVIAAITRLRQAACNPRLIVPDSPIQSTKMNTFTELVEQLISGGHKILVFSQFVKHLKLVIPELESRGIAYKYLDGATPMNERIASVNAFQQGEGDVFLISLKAGGLGLNLTAADYVIHLDPWWNPAVEDQASDRAYRIGQDKPVTIYRLITHNTIEDEILKLHQSKRDLADNLLSGTDTLDKVGIDELMKLLTMPPKREEI